MVRMDIPIADQIVQVGHVCALAASTFDVPERCRLVLLAVEDEQAIVDAAGRCRQFGIRSVSFYDSDPVDEGSMPPQGWRHGTQPTVATGTTALCTEPIPKSARGPLRRYRLWREPRELSANCA